MPFLTQKINRKIKLASTIIKLNYYYCFPKVMPITFLQQLFEFLSTHQPIFIINTSTDR